MLSLQIEEKKVKSKQAMELGVPHVKQSTRTGISVVQVPSKDASILISWGNKRRQLKTPSCPSSLVNKNHHHRRPTCLHSAASNLYAPYLRKSTTVPPEYEGPTPAVTRQAIRTCGITLSSSMIFR